MFQVPTSSAMMTTMLGFFPEAVGSAWAAVVFASDWASNTLPAGQSGQEEGRLTSGSDRRVSAATGQTGCRTLSAREAGAMSLVATTKPSNAPSPMHATD
jgi:hypothetical protein